MATPAPRSLTGCCLPCAPRRGLLKRSQGPQVTPAGCPQWPPCTCGPLPTGPGWAATCWGLFWPLGGCLPPALLGILYGVLSGERLPQLQRWPTRWVSPLGGASPESQPQEALGTSYSYTVPQAAAVRQGRPGAGGLAGISPGLPPLLLVPGPPLSGFCPVAQG